jgi:hypothetical protein
MSTRSWQRRSIEIAEDYVREQRAMIAGATREVGFTAVNTEQANCSAHVEAVECAQGRPCGESTKRGVAPAETRR